MQKKGDVLLSVRAPVDTFNVANENCCIGRGLAALNSKTGFDSFLLYSVARLRSFFDIQDANGTTFGSITKDTLYDVPVVYPTDEILTEYETKVKKYDKMIASNEIATRGLIQLRDWLLPMLMNGQINLFDKKCHCR